jgi:hypothetical protein
MISLSMLRGYGETRHQAKSWDRDRSAIARIEATELGLDLVITSLEVGSVEWTAQDATRLWACPGFVER